MKYAVATIAVGLCVAVGGWVYHDSLDAVEQAASQNDQGPLPVEVTRLQQQTIQDRVELVGSLEAVSEVRIRARESGYVEQLAVEVGDRIEQGRLAVKLHNDQKAEAVSRARAALRVAEAQLEEQRAKTQQAEDKLARLMELGESGVSTAQQREGARAQVAIAQARLELQKAQVAQAESQLSTSELALDETGLEAPMTGYVAERLVDVGDLANPNDPLLRIVRLAEVQTVVHVVEQDYARIQTGQEATISVDAFPEKRFPGKVVRKAPAFDPATRTAAIHVGIPNPESLLKPGMHATVRIVLQQRSQADVVPIAALLNRQQQPAVYVVDGNPPTTHLREVETGIRDGEMVEILAGLGAKDRVVTLGSRMVEPEQRVKPVEADAAGSVPEREKMPQISHLGAQK